MNVSLKNYKVMIAELTISIIKAIYNLGVLHHFQVTGLIFFFSMTHVGMHIVRYFDSTLVYVHFFALLSQQFIIIDYCCFFFTFCCYFL